MAAPRICYKIADTVFREFEWIYITLGLLGNVSFFTGSLFFFFGVTFAAKLFFIFGSFLMLIGSIGSAVIRCVSARRARCNASHHSEGMARSAS